MQALPAANARGGLGWSGLILALALESLVSVRSDGLVGDWGASFFANTPRWPKGVFQTPASECVRRTFHLILKHQMGTSLVAHQVSCGSG